MKKKKFRVLEGERGDPCPRCGRDTEVREHTEITDKHLRQPVYYSRWFYCSYPHCKTTLIMPDRYRVFPDEPQPEASTEDDDIFALAERGGKPPWED